MVLGNTPRLTRGRPFPSCLLPHFQNESAQNHSNKNEFDLHENGRAGEVHFHMNGFAWGLVLKMRLVLAQRQKVTRKWPIDKRFANGCQ